MVERGLESRTDREGRREGRGMEEQGGKERGKLTNGWSRHVSDKINGLGARYRWEQGTRAILEKKGRKGEWEEVEE